MIEKKKQKNSFLNWSKAAYQKNSGKKNNQGECVIWIAADLHGQTTQNPYRKVVASI